MIRDLLNGKGIIDTEELEFAVKFGKNVLADLMKSITKMLNSSMELDEFSKIYTKQVDGVILSEEEKTGNKFKGGEFKIFHINDRTFGLSYSLYFHDGKEGWTKMTAKSEPMDNYYLSDEALQELREKMTIVYEVEQPTDEARKEYDKMKREKSSRPKRVE